MKNLFLNIYRPESALMIFIFYPLIATASLADERGEPQTSDAISALDRRIQIERNTRYQAFVLTPHRPNYILPLSYSRNPNNTAMESTQDGELDNYEIKFQLSVKFPILENLFGGQGSLQFAYTNLSFWQAYNVAASRPFRETVHEPEVFLIFKNNWNILGMDNRLIQLGISHQSNGQSGQKSRTWNRAYADFIFQRDDFYLSIKPWYHLKETDSADDENPDIEKYLGHGEFRAAYAGGNHTVSLMLRNNFKSPNYGAVEINWSFPMTRRVKWFLQYFDGYGESLIDYNARISRVGVGVAFTDWL